MDVVDKETLTKFNQLKIATSYNDLGLQNYNLIIFIRNSGYLQICYINHTGLKQFCKRIFTSILLRYRKIYKSL